MILKEDTTRITISKIADTKNQNEVNLCSIALERTVKANSISRLETGKPPLIDDSSLTDANESKTRLDTMSETKHASSESIIYFGNVATRITRSPSASLFEYDPLQMQVKSSNDTLGEHADYSISQSQNDDIIRDIFDERIPFSL